MYIYIVENSVAMYSLQLHITILFVIPKRLEFAANMSDKIIEDWKLESPNIFALVDEQEFDFLVEGEDLGFDESKVKG